MDIKKTIRRSLISFFLVLFMVIVGRGMYMKANDPYKGTVDYFTASQDEDAVLSYKEAVSDINYFMNKLRGRHPAWLEGENTGVLEVESRYLEIISGLGESISVIDLNRELKYLVSPLHDGHTYVYHESKSFEEIDDYSYQEAYGHPVKINGEKIEDIASRYLEISSYEIEEVQLENFYEDAFNYKSMLYMLGIDVSNGVTFTYLIDGKETDIHHDFVVYSYADEEDTSSEEPWVYYDIDVTNGIAVFTLRQCNYNNYYTGIVKEFFEATTDNNIKDVVIDLRDNYGGSSQVANEFLRYIAIEQYNGWDSDVRMGKKLYKNRNIVHQNNRLAPQYDGNLWVLTNKNTYSAAMDFTMLIMDNNLGKVVGEPSSNLPDSYGDCLYFQLPNSKLCQSVSYKRWYRIDKSKAGEQLIPDYQCDPKFALEKVLEVK